MVAISLMLEGQYGMTWYRWKKLVAEVEDLGFAGMFRSDHFTNANPPDMDSLEMIVSLTYLADHTRRIHFGPLVAPFSFRNPMLLARQAAALDDLSGGRMILGVGAGWQEREHQLFGFELGDIATRMARFAEGLEVVTRLLKSDEAVTYEGRFYQLRGATLLPRPQRKGGPRILIGGNGPKRTLPLVARYANIWNGTFLAPDEFRERSAILDKLLSEAGRKPGDVRRTAMRGLYFGRDMKELDRRLRWRAENPDYAGKSLQEVIDSMATRDHEIVGTADMVIEQIKTYEAAGAEELMLQWFDVDDLDGLRTFAKSVLPNV
ncbi:MAG TPA: LLM class F420-dependent oxidoreductase [Ktedonobacter sp.]|jgi:F420-dependent oxidoreductase-like protein|nr:LLM class F420-dependent oxidoreductase [Ktedonobacter sp.]HCF85193.1 LLM class F420-dependent oxidoreductase [Ktedonobacter sp.]